MLKKIFLIILSFLIPFILYGESKDTKTKKAEQQVLLNLKKEYAKLKQMENRLNDREKRLKELELRIITEQQEIIKIQKRISSILEEIKKIREENVSQLAIVYSKMKPENAAEVINNMPTSLAVKIFLKMQPNKIAKILNYADQEKAIKITEKLALYGININLKGR